MPTYTLLTTARLISIGLVIKWLFQPEPLGLFLVMVVIGAGLWAHDAITEHLAERANAEARALLVEPLSDLGKALDAQARAVSRIGG